MTEQDWLQATDPERMLDFLRGKASERKLRLFACACCRRFWHLVEDERSQKAVEVSERYADGLASRTEVASARRQLKADYRNKHRAAIAKAVSEQSAFGWAFGWDMAHYTLRAKASDAAHLGILGANRRQEHWPVVLLHDIFGPLPFRTVAFDLAWLTWHDSLLVSMAQQMYDSRDFRDMPILADALEEAGCTNADILSHLRGPGPHVRGCWVVDAILGKS